MTAQNVQSSGRNAAVWGLTAFAAILMILSGLWSFFVGLAAIIKGEFFVLGANYVYEISTTGWGWVHLILGIIVAAAGVCLLLGQTWARMAGVVLAVLSALANFLWLPYYPLWAIAVIVLDVLIIWALLSGTPRGERV